MNLYISCATGLQQVLKKELQILGYKPTILKSTLLTFPGDESAIAQSNLRLRTANKVYLEIASQKTQTFDELFDFVYAQDRSKYVDKFTFTVKATSNNSKLFSTPTIQSISEKAIHKKLKNLSSLTKKEGAKRKVDLWTRAEEGPAGEAIRKKKKSAADIVCSAKVKKYCKKTACLSAGCHNIR